VQARRLRPLVGQGIAPARSKHRSRLYNRARVYTRASLYTGSRGVWKERRLGVIAS
jgi:hypothetical protein